MVRWHTTFLTILLILGCRVSFAQNKETHSCVPPGYWRLESLDKKSPLLKALPDLSLPGGAFWEGDPGEGDWEPTPLFVTNGKKVIDFEKLLYGYNPENKIIVELSPEKGVFKILLSVEGKPMESRLILSFKWGHFFESDPGPGSVDSYTPRPIHFDGTATDKEIFLIGEMKIEGRLGDYLHLASKPAEFLIKSTTDAHEGSCKTKVEHWQLLFSGDIQVSRDKSNPALEASVKQTQALTIHLQK